MSTTGTSYPYPAECVQKHKPAPGHSGALPLQPGDRVTVLSSADDDGDWLNGRSESSGKEGVFPSDCVKKVELEGGEANVAVEGGEVVGRPNLAEEGLKASIPAPAAHEDAQATIPPPTASVEPISIPPPSESKAPTSSEPPQPVPIVRTGSDLKPIPSRSSTEGSPSAPKSPPPPVAAKSSSLKDRIAAFNKQSSSSAPPLPSGPKPKPPPIVRKPIPPPAPSITSDSGASPSSGPTTTTTAAAGGDERERSSVQSGMSASDAAESIARGGGLKERMKALQGAFGAASSAGQSRGPPPVVPKKKKVSGDEVTIGGVSPSSIASSLPTAPTPSEETRPTPVQILEDKPSQAAATPVPVTTDDALASPTTESSMPPAPPAPAPAPSSAPTGEVTDETQEAGEGAGGGERTEERELTEEEKEIERKRLIRERMARLAGSGGRPMMGFGGFGAGPAATTTTAAAPGPIRKPSTDSRSSATSLNTTENSAKQPTTTEDVPTEQTEPASASFPSPPSQPIEEDDLKIPTRPSLSTEASTTEVPEAMPAPPVARRTAPPKRKLPKAVVEANERAEEARLRAVAEEEERRRREEEEERKRQEEEEERKRQEEEKKAREEERKRVEAEEKAKLEAEAEEKKRLEDEEVEKAKLGEEGETVEPKADGEGETGVEDISKQVKQTADEPSEAVAKETGPAHEEVQPEGAKESEKHVEPHELDKPVVVPEETHESKTDEAAAVPASAAIAGVSFAAAAGAVKGEVASHEEGHDAEAEDPAPATSQEPAQEPTAESRQVLKEDVAPRSQPEEEAVGGDREETVVVAAPPAIPFTRPSAPEPSVSLNLEDPAVALDSPTLGDFPAVDLPRSVKKVSADPAGDKGQPKETLPGDLPKGDETSEERGAGERVTEEKVPTEEELEAERRKGIRERMAKLAGAGRIPMFGAPPPTRTAEPKSVPKEAPQATTEPSETGVPEGPVSESVPAVAAEGSADQEEQPEEVEQTEEEKEAERKRLLTERMARLAGSGARPMMGMGPANMSAPPPPPVRPDPVPASKGAESPAETSAPPPPAPSKRLSMIATSAPVPPTRSPVPSPAVPVAEPTPEPGVEQEVEHEELEEPEEEEEVGAIDDEGQADDAPPPLPPSRPSAPTPSQAAAGIVAEPAEPVLETPSDAGLAEEQIPKQDPSEEDGDAEPTSKVQSQGRGTAPTVGAPPVAAAEEAAEEGEEEDPEVARRRALAKRMAAMGGMRIGMMPMAAPVPKKKSSTASASSAEPATDPTVTGPSGERDEDVAPRVPGRRLPGVPAGGFALPGILPPARDSEPQKQEAADVEEDEDLPAPPPPPRTARPLSQAPARIVHDIPLSHEAAELEGESGDVMADEPPPPPPPSRPAGGHRSRESSSDPAYVYSPGAPPPPVPKSPPAVPSSPTASRKPPVPQGFDNRASVQSFSAQRRTSSESSSRGNFEETEADDQRPSSVSLSSRPSQRRLPAGAMTLIPVQSRASGDYRRSASFAEEEGEGLDDAPPPLPSSRPPPPPKDNTNRNSFINFSPPPQLEGFSPLGPAGGPSAPPSAWAPQWQSQKGVAYKARDVEIPQVWMQWLHDPSAPEPPPEINQVASWTHHVVNGTRLLTVLYDDYSRSIVRLESSEEHGGQRNPQVMQHHIPPPAPSDGELHTLTERFAAELLARAGTQTSPDTSPASGASLLASSDATPPVGNRFGWPIYCAKAHDKQVEVISEQDVVRAGDIVIADECKFQAKGLKGIQQSLKIGQGGSPYFGIVAEVEEKRKDDKKRDERKIKVRTVAGISFKVEELKSGSLQIYRPLPKAWLLQF